MNSFTIYEEYYDLITILPDIKEQGELLVAICDYMFFNKDPILNTNQMKIFRNLKRPLDVSKKNSKKSKQEQNENQNKTQKETNENPKWYPNDIQTKTHQDVYVNSKCNGEVNRGVGEEETLAKTEEQVLETEFGKLWEYYPNKAGESYAKESYLTARKNGTSYEKIAQGLKEYLKHLKTNNVPTQYVKKGSNWFKESCWNDKYPVNSTNEPEWLKTKIKRNEATLEEQNELEELIKGVSNNE